MTYFQFLISFVVLPSLLLLSCGFYLGRGSNGSKESWGWHLFGVAALAGIAFVWTTPWDNYIVAKGVWSYGVDRVIAVVGYVPVEEYLFFILMPIFNGALFFCLLKIFGGIHRAKSAGSKNFRVLSLIVGGCLMLLGAMFLRSGNHFFYLACTLIWFVPPLMIQWFFDPIALFRNWRLVLFGTALPTLYFSAVDLFAIRNGIWTISDPTRTGWEFLGLPVEEAFFFFIVSLLLSQGMVLWHGLREK